MIEGQRAPAGAPTTAAPFLFALALFSSAALLFLVEPMLARMLLPLLGGTPAVWNTCLVFFQAALLTGYLYAHASLHWLGKRTQLAVHLTVLLSALLVLPLRLPAAGAPQARQNPVLWILITLAATVGVPFFALAASAPVLQKWFAWTSHRSAADPYFLYAASNAGSLLGLLCYPLLLEPLLALSSQTRVWSFGYAGLIALVAVCAALVLRMSPDEAAHPRESRGAPTPWKDRARWIALAFVPSSLMLGFTTALTTDVPAIPFFWVLPLAVYLLSFVLVFASKPPVSHRMLVRRLPFLILIALIPTVAKTRLPVAVLLLIYLSALFAIAMVCHGELARGRPAVGRLTEFYLWISFGGVLGGIFNSLVAPVVFSSVVEFPLVMVFAALLRPAPEATGDASRRARRISLPAGVGDWLLPALLGLSMTAVIAFARHRGLKPGLTANTVIFGYSILWCLSFGKRPLRFSLGLIAVLLASSSYTGAFGRILYTERSFFGVSRVTDDSAGRFRSLFHGGTIHGVQSLDPARGHEPLSYYTKAGPIGQVFAEMASRAPFHVAIVGLGAGAMACYMRPGDALTYYEIDRSVVSIATNPNFFTFLGQCAPGAGIVLGDARLSLRNAPKNGYRLIVLDAFSGDSIPVHLLTREALRLYIDKLAPEGLVAFHISNLYLDLTPALEALARDSGLASLVRDDTAVSEAEMENGRMPSKWVVMARSTADMGGLAKDPRWVPPPVNPRQRVWTDDYSNLLAVIRWR